LHLAGQTSSYYPLVLAYNNMIQIIMNGKNVTQVLSALDQDPLMPKVEQPYSSLLSLTAIVSRSLQNPVTPDGNPGWMVLSNVQSILAVPMQQQLFIGLVMVREKAALKTQIKFDGVDLYTLINRHWRRIDSLTNWIGESVAAYQAILADVKKLNDFRHASPPGTLPTSELIASYSRDIVQVLTVVYDFPLIDRNALIAKFPALPKVFLAMNSWVQVSAEIASDNYGLALSDVVDVLQLLINDPKVVAAVNKYGGFAVSIAKAKSAQDFDKALEAAALPVGSYQIKRSSYKNISLNAYAGLFGAWQHYPGDLPAGVKRDNSLIGFTAPVGVAYSWGSYYHSGTKKDSLQGSSNTIFLSVLDVGAITSFRLTHDSSATLPDFKWNNVLAPGLFYIYGFRRSPLSLGGGVQYGPQLRSITNNAAVVLPSAITYRLFLVVDIPLFDFYTRRETN